MVVTKQPCEYQRCGGKGGRRVAKPRIARKRISALGRQWFVCESCAHLLRMRPTTAPQVPASRPLAASDDRVLTDGRRHEVRPPSPSSDATAALEASLMTLIREAGVTFYDRRAKGDALWLVGGSELQPLVRTCGRLGILFRFRPEGSRATRMQPAWWTQWPTW